MKGARIEGPCGQELHWVEINRRSLSKTETV